MNSRGPFMPLQLFFINFQAKFSLNGDHPYKDVESTNGHQS
jgi:hypothetical protein